jgi:hypothetical protein
MFVFGVVAIEVWDTKFPVQYFILALVISFVYVIPSACFFPPPLFPPHLRSL